MLFTLATFKSRMTITGSVDDATLTGIAEWVHTLFDQWCNRTLAYTDGAELIISGTVQDVSLPCYPVESILSVSSRDHARAAWRPLSRLTWLLDASSGILTFRSGAIGSESEQIRILYSGGYVLPGTTALDGQTELPRSIQEAALAQAVHFYETRHLHVAAATGSAPAKAARDVELLPAVEMTLRPYRRMVL